jgi:site-specific recombinase XerC
MLFDWLVTGQVVATNPAHAVRGPKHVVKTGKTTVLTGEEAHELLDSIDTSTLVGLRDRAVISVMTFAFARIGACAAQQMSAGSGVVTAGSRKGCQALDFIHEIVIRSTSCSVISSPVRS